MPIKRRAALLYPIDWRELSAVIRFSALKAGASDAVGPMAKRSYTSAMGAGGIADCSTWRSRCGRPLESCHRRSF